MFYRQKIMLALIESFGGTLESTRFEKLMFQFCRSMDKDFYDFVPYTYGCFSFMTYYDKRNLCKKGFLKKSEKFETTGNQTFINQLKDGDRERLHQFRNGMKEVSNKDLVRETYRSYPYYAVRSEILDEILDSDEQEKVYREKPGETAAVLFTIGYEGRSLDAYLNMLIKNNIKALVDVRKKAFSMKYGFSKKILKECLSKLNIAYYHVPELGIESSLRKNLESKKDYDSLFEYYREHILKGNNALQEIPEILAEHQRIALTCFEKDPEYCHRQQISNWFRKDQKTIPVNHL